MEDKRNANMEGLSMTQADIWRYLLDGGKIRPNWWPDYSFIEMKDGYACNQRGQKMNMWGFSSPEDYLLLKEEMIHASK